MSAFIVDDAHINALISFALLHRVSYWNAETKTRVDITEENAEEVGRILMDQNVRSVAHRYSDISTTEQNAAADYTFRPYPVLSPVTILKAIDCLDYQSCETDDWDCTLAWRILRSIASYAIRRLPGYEESPGWGIGASSKASP